MIRQPFTFPNEERKEHERVWSDAPRLGRRKEMVLKKRINIVDVDVVVAIDSSERRFSRLVATNGTHIKLLHREACRLNGEFGKRAQVAERHRAVSGVELPRQQHFLSRGKLHVKRLLVSQNRDIAQLARQQSIRYSRNPYHTTKLCRKPSLAKDIFQHML